MARTLVASDNFNRASLGADWDTSLNAGDGGVININANRFTGQYSNFASSNGYLAAARWVGSGSFTDDQYFAITLNNIDDVLGLNYMIGGLLRAGSGTNAARNYYQVMLKGGVSTGVDRTMVGRVVAGVYTELYSNDSTTWANSDALSAEIEGTDIRVYKNGSLITTVTDASLSTGFPGICANANYFGDDWEGGNVSNVISLTGNIDLAAIVAAGSISIVPASALSGDISLDDLVASGVISGAIPGVLTTLPIVNNSDQVYANLSGVILNIYNLSGVLVSRRTGLTTDANGVIQVIDSNVSPGQFYAYEVDLTVAGFGRRLPTAQAV